MARRSWRGAPRWPLPTARRAISVLVAGFFVASLVGNPSSAAVSHAPSPTKPGGAARTRGPTAAKHLVFSDHFANGTLDRTRWDTCYPWADARAGCTNFGNPELEWYLPSQAQVTGKALHLITEKTPTPGTSRDGQPTLYGWRSGMVTTFHSFVFTYGYVEVRARAPRGEGLWSALWLLPKDESFPPEIDVAEIYGTDPSRVSLTLHPKAGPQQSQTASGADLSVGWHTYGVDWEPSSITWYVDGKVQYRYRGSTPAQPMYFLADLAVANLWWAGNPDLAPSTASLDLQSVSIYQH